MPDILLQARNLSIAFGGLKAVQDVDLAVPQGSLTALVGPNGAGKTTLFALLSGFLKPSAGSVHFGGKDITGRAPHESARLGLTRTFQIVQPFGAQTSGTGACAGHAPTPAAARRGVGRAESERDRRNDSGGEKAGGRWRHRVDD